MITITIKMKTNEYMPKIDRAFKELANMNKIADGKYESDKDVLTNCYKTAKALMCRSWFRNNVEKMNWIVDDEPESDLVKHFIDRIAEEGGL